MCFLRCVGAVRSLDGELAQPWPFFVDGGRMTRFFFPHLLLGI